MTSQEVKLKVGDGPAPYRKITVDIGRLVWSNHPLHADDHVVLQMLQQEVVLRFDNGKKGRPKKVEFEVTSEQQFDRFMARHVRIHLVHGDEVIGNSCFDPSLMQEKMVLPVFARGTTVKLGDFALKVTVVKPPTDPLVLAELSGFLSRLGHRNPQLLMKMHDELHRQQYL